MAEVRAPLVNDAAVEPDETFAVTVSNAADGLGTQLVGALTVSNDDTTPAGPAAPADEPAAAGDPAVTAHPRSPLPAPISRDGQGAAGRNVVVGTAGPDRRGAPPVRT